MNIKNYLHYYIGSMCYKKNSTVTNKKPEKLNMWLIKWANGQGCRTLIPILRPLSDITEEEKSAFVKVSELEPEDVECIILFKDRFFDGQVGYGTAHLTNILQWANGVHYLLSRGFDLFGLIEAGLAISKSEASANG